MFRNQSPPKKPPTRHGAVLFCAGFDLNLNKEANMKKNLTSLIWVILAGVLGYLFVLWRRPHPAPTPNLPVTQPIKKEESKSAQLFHSSKKVMGSLADITIVTQDEALAQKS